MNPRYTSLYRFSTTPIGINSSFQRQLKSMITNCKVEMGNYSSCVMKDGIQT